MACKLDQIFKNIGELDNSKNFVVKLFAKYIFCEFGKCAFIFSNG